MDLLLRVDPKRLRELDPARLRQVMEMLESDRRMRRWRERKPGIGSLVRVLLRGGPERLTRRRKQGPAQRVRLKALSHPEMLAASLMAGRISVGRVAELLRIDPADVPAIASGRVGLSRRAWLLVKRELAVAAGRQYHGR
jgi:hypothetical protein